MYTSVGVLQRDAPRQGHKPEFQQMQRQLATDLSGAVSTFKGLLEEEVPAMFEGYQPGDGIWPSEEEIRQILDSRIEAIEEAIRLKMERVDKMQAFYEQYTDELIHSSDQM